MSQGLQVAGMWWKPVSSQSLNKGEELVHPRPRRWSCVRQEFHDLRSCHRTTRNVWMVALSCFLDQNGSKRILAKNSFIPLWPGSNPNDYEWNHQVLGCQPSQGYRDEQPEFTRESLRTNLGGIPPTWHHLPGQYAAPLSVNVCCVASVVICVLSPRHEAQRAIALWSPTQCSSWPPISFLAERGSHPDWNDDTPDDPPFEALTPRNRLSPLFFAPPSASCWCPRIILQCSISLSYQDSDSSLTSRIFIAWNRHCPAFFSRDPFLASSKNWLRLSPTCFSQNVFLTNFIVSGVLASPQSYLSSSHSLRKGCDSSCFILQKRKAKSQSLFRPNSVSYQQKIEVFFCLLSLQWLQQKPASKACVPKADKLNNTFANLNE